MTLNDFPAFAVEEITEASDELRLRGRFSHLAGVTLGRSYLYCGDAQWVGDLIECDADTRHAVFTAPSWVQRDRIKVGTVVPWLPASWQFFHVNMILKSRWERRAFVSSDAQHFQQGNVYGWTKVGSKLRSDQVPTHIEKDGWDHEECEICYAHVGRAGLPEGYVNQDEVWLCLTCFERYGRTKDLGFIFPAQGPPLASERQDVRRHGSIVRVKRIAWIGIVILAALSGVVVVLFVPRPVWSYKGPGTMRDYGVLSHPRYELKLPGISTEDKYRSFSFAGVPSEEMTLMLYIAGATLDKLEKPLTALDTQITAQLFEEATPLVPRRVLCCATGSPSTASRDSRWVATGNDAFVALWHSRCLRVPMSKDRRYTLTLEIADSGLSSLAKILVPTLAGGGYELP